MHRACTEKQLTAGPRPLRYNGVSHSHKRDDMKRFLCCLLCFVATSFSQSTAHKSVRGVWLMVEETTTSITNSSPQPGIIIFTDKYYSLVHVASTNPRPDLPSDMNKATPADLIAVWGDLAFGANSGTYEISGATLTTHSMVAKNPLAMKRVTDFTYRLEGDNLWLRINQRADQRTFKLRRLE